MEPMAFRFMGGCSNQLSHTSQGSFVCLFIILYLFIFRERGREGGRERNISVWLCLTHAPPLPTGDSAHNPGICPDWESSWRPSGSQANTQSTESHQPGLRVLFKKKFFFFQISWLVRERKNINSLLHLCIHWLLLICALTRTEPITLTNGDKFLTN